MLNNIKLPIKIFPQESLARVICDSSKKQRYTKTAFKFDDQEKCYKVVASQFIDTRYPTTLSVNRISTLSKKESHKLGLEHQSQRQPSKTYHGYASILAKICFENQCKVEQEDYEGTKPYHANIIYPYEQNQKEDKQEIAIQLAYHSEFIRYSKDKDL